MQEVWLVLGRAENQARMQGKWLGCETAAPLIWTVQPTTRKLAPSTMCSRVASALPEKVASVAACLGTPRFKRYVFFLVWGIGQHVHAVGPPVPTGSRTAGAEGAAAGLLLYFLLHSLRGFSGICGLALSSKYDAVEKAAYAEACLAPWWA